MDSNALPFAPPQPQQQLQAIITFAMPPGLKPGGLNVASASNQLILANNLLNTAKTTKDKHVRAFTIFVRVSMALMIAGVSNIVLGGVILISEFISMPSDGLSSLGLAGVWSCFVFSVTNGALAIKSATLKPHITRPWAWVNLGFGIAALFVRLASLIFTFLNIINSGYEPSYPYNNSPDSNLIVKFSSDGARLVVCVTLLIADICRLVAMSVAVSLLGKFPHASTPSSTSTPGPAPTEVCRPASLLEPTATHSDDYATPLIPSDLKP